MTPLRLALLVLSALALAAGPAAAQPQQPAGRPPLPVVASISILADMTREIGGDRVAVASLVGPGGDAHVYQPTPSDARAAAGAALVIVNGLGLEGWLPRLIEASGFKGRIATATQGIVPLDAEDEAHGHGHREQRGSGNAGHPDADPHAWQDAANGAAYARNIAAALADADPADADFFRTRGDAYAAQLAALDADLRRDFAAIPQEKRRVITSHDAFRYFGRAYGIEFLAPVGVSTESEPSAGAVAALIRQMRREKIRALFVETISDPRLVEQLAREAGAAVGPPLYSDSLAPPGQEASTYAGMLRYNARALAEGMRKN